jgi:hypothetical protein
LSIWRWRPCLPKRPAALSGERSSIEAEAAGLRGGVAAAAAALSGRRRAAAGHLRVAVESCLAGLAMAGSRFDVRIGWEPCAQVTACQETGTLDAACAMRASSMTADTCRTHRPVALPTMGQALQVALVQFAISACAAWRPAVRQRLDWAVLACASPHAWLSAVVAHAPRACDLLQGDVLHIAPDLAEPVHEAGGRGYRVRDSGLDCVEFLLAAGPAEPLRPLAAVASGGESARIMMALKMAPAAAAAAVDGGAGPLQTLLVWALHFTDFTCPQRPCPHTGRR